MSQQQRHQFHLRWSNYGQNLANSFLRLFESESLSDVTLFCEGESYRAHRVVLAASSVHFQELFEQCSTAQNLVVILDGTLAANLRALLEFMYKGEVYIDDANLNTFLQTAKRLQVKGLSLSQNDLHSISGDVDERVPGGGGGPLVSGDGKHAFTSAGGGNAPSTQDPLLAQALGPLLIPSHQQPPPSHIAPHHVPLQNKNTNCVQSPPNSFSPPSPSRSPPNTINATTGMYDDKLRKKNRFPPSSPRESPNGTLGEGMEYVGMHHPARPSAPLPSPSSGISARLEMEMRDRQSMAPHGGFGTFGGSHYVPSVGVSSSVTPSSAPLQSHQQQQTIVITENPNLRKMRSASTENTMPEDLSIKLEVGRDDEVGTIGMSEKQRSYSMDLSPSDGQPFGGGLGGSGGPPSTNIWPLPSPSSVSAQHAQTHDLNHTQTTADGKKLKCPFCERLYGYETNLRAHIRQRHQGIRVPCPFCTRTFTRNNTVRRHVAREHRSLLGGVGGVRSFPHMAQDPLAPTGPPSFPSPPRSGNNGSSGSSPSQGSPGNNSGGTNAMGLGSAQSHHSHGPPTSGHSPSNRPSSRGSSGGVKGMD